MECCGRKCDRLFSVGRNRSESFGAPGYIGQLRFSIGQGLDSNGFVPMIGKRRFLRLPQQSELIAMVEAIFSLFGQPSLHRGVVFNDGIFLRMFDTESSSQAPNVEFIFLSSLGCSCDQESEPPTQGRPLLFKDFLEMIS